MTIEALIAVVSANPATTGFIQAANTISVVLGILSFMGMMLIFVYKNRNLSLQNKADIEHERTRRTVLEREVVELRERVARIEGGIRHD